MGLMPVLRPKRIVLEDLGGGGGKKVRHYTWNGVEMVAESYGPLSGWMSHVQHGPSWPVPANWRVHITGGLLGLLGFYWGGG